MRAQRGFTLIELMIAMAVLVIASTLAVPSFITFIQNNRLASQTNDLVAAFQFARSEALKRGVPVTLCSSSNGEDCMGDFSEGWIALINEGTSDSEVLRIWDAPVQDIEFSPGSEELTFVSTGFLDQGEGPLVLRLSIAGCPNTERSFIRVERSGRVSVDREDCP